MSRWIAEMVSSSTMSVAEPSTQISTGPPAEGLWPLRSQLSAKARTAKGRVSHPCKNQTRKGRPPEVTSVG